MNKSNSTPDDTPANYGRWDTFDGTIKLIGEPSPEQQAAIDEINASLTSDERNPDSPNYDPRKVDWNAVDEAEARINHRMV